MAGSKRRRSSRGAQSKAFGAISCEADYQGKRHKATILSVEDDASGKMYFVHYEGWNSRYDQWLSEDKVTVLDGDAEMTPDEDPQKETSSNLKSKRKVEDDFNSNDGLRHLKAKKEQKTIVKTEKKKKDGLSSYEAQRLENIRRNQEMLAKLNLQSIAQSMKPKKQKIVRMKNKKKPAARAPSRRSLRVQGLGSDGKKLPDNFRPLATKPYNVERPAREEGTLEISPSNLDFLKNLTKKSDKSSAGTESSAEVDAPTVKYAERLAKLGVSDDSGYVKLTKERIYSAAVHPGTERIMMAAGDKRGNLGLWKVGDKDEGVVASFHPHSATIAGLMFDKSDSNKLYTASYEGRIRMLDLEQQAFSEVFQDLEDSFYGMDAVNGSPVFYAASLIGSVRQIDPRANDVQEFALHDNKIFTVSINQANTHEFVTASLDRTMRVWDIRKLSSKKPKAVHTMIHGLCVTGASYSPQGTHIVSTCNDNLLRVWATADLKKGGGKGKDGNGPDPSSQVRHNNQTGRWLTKFKCEWDPKQNNAFVIGSLDQPRCIEVFGVNEKSGKASRIMRLRDDWVASVQSVNHFHPELDVILSANSSGRTYVWRS